MLRLYNTKSLNPVSSSPVHHPYCPVFIADQSSMQKPDEQTLLTTGTNRTKRKAFVIGDQNSHKKLKDFSFENSQHHKQLPPTSSPSFPITSCPISNKTPSLQFRSKRSLQFSDQCDFIYPSKKRDIIPILPKSCPEYSSCTSSNSIFVNEIEPQPSNRLEHSVNFLQQQNPNHSDDTHNSDISNDIPITETQNNQIVLSRPMLSYDFNVLRRLYDPPQFALIQKQIMTVLTSSSLIDIPNRFDVWKFVSPNHFDHSGVANREYNNVSSDDSRNQHQKCKSAIEIFEVDDDGNRILDNDVTMTYQSSDNISDNHQMQID